MQICTWLAPSGTSPLVLAGTDKGSRTAPRLCKSRQPWRRLAGHDPDVRALQGGEQDTNCVTSGVCVLRQSLRRNTDK